MSKVAVIYWSGTGNTKNMAEAVLNGAKSANADAELYIVSDISAADAANYDAIALGCPAMGAEELEESEFAPFFDALESSLSGKKIGLFGSYGWGDGEWMRNWEERAKSAGANVVAAVIANEAPDDEAVKNCEELGKALA